MFSLFAEIERDLISERTKEGLARARAEGKQLGRPKGPGRSKLDHGLSPAKAAMAMGSVAFASIPSRIFWGMVVEKLHIRKCMIITSIGLATSVLFIMMADSFGTAVFSMMLYGFFAGGTVVYDAMVWSEFFGRLELGSIQGFAEVFRFAGYAGGPLIAAIIYDTLAAIILPSARFLSAAFLPPG
jgi:MFS family permease